jgi:hypothetical protein
VEPDRRRLGHRLDGEGVSEEKYLLEVLSPQLSQLGGGEAVGVHYAREAPVVGRLALALPAVDVVGVVAVDVDHTIPWLTTRGALPGLAIELRESAQTASSSKLS